MLSLASETPLFHSLALGTLQEQPDSYMAEFVKPTLREIHVNDPGTTLIEAVVIEDAPESTITTGSIVIIDG